MVCFDDVIEMGRDKLLRKINSIGYEISNSQKVISGLYNSDISAGLLVLIEQNLEEFLLGLKTLNFALRGDTPEIYLTENQKIISDKSIKRLIDEGVDISYGLISRRKEKNSYYCHISDVLKLYEYLSGENIDYSFIQINGSDPIKAENKKTLRDYLNDQESSSRWFEIGNSFYDKNVLDMKIGSLNLRNGVVNTVENEKCILHEAELKIEKFREKSCGKCVFCREGLIQLQGHMSDITSGKGKPGSMAMMQEIGEAMCFSSCCTLGEEAANGILSSMRYGEDEYLQHIKKKKCRSGVCISNENIYVDPSKCNGCSKCISVCPHDCIDGKKGYIHMLYDLDCTKCGECIPVCPENAIISTESRVPKLPDRMIKAGMFR